MIKVSEYLCLDCFTSNGSEQCNCNQMLRTPALFIHRSLQEYSLLLNEITSLLILFSDKDLFHFSWRILFSLSYSLPGFAASASCLPVVPARLSIAPSAGQTCWTGIGPAASTLSISLRISFPSSRSSPAPHPYDHAIPVRLRELAPVAYW